MANLKAIRNRITSVKGTQQITGAMRMVAAAKMRRATESINAARPYADKLGGIIQNLSSQVLTSTSEALLSPLFTQREENNILIVSVAADRGLCGGFNANINKSALLIANQYKAEGKTVKFVCIGKKSSDFFKKRDFEVIESYTDIFNHLQYEIASNISNYVSNLFVNGSYDKIVLVYNEFKSVIAQVQKNIDFLPIVPEQKDEEEENTGIPIEFIFEPSPAVILETLLPKHLTMQIWKALLDSNAAEQGARMAAMESATENAKDLIKSLNLIYNRSRQAAITQEISEIVGGAEAIAS
ncbi:MAG: ATP synthase F1 subunit gamma [Calditrichaeota bacterium]|nr:MAG: ATP synthase F1 subunit gamma [Calditrichota bacterium]